MVDIVKLIEEFNETHNKFIETMKAEFHGLFKEFFAQNQSVKCIVWNQYTPYFADGDPCTFRVNEMYASTTMYEGGRGEEMEGVIEGKPSQYYFDNYPTNEWCKSVVEKYNSLDEDERKTSENVQQFLNLINKIPDEIYESLFGDHVTVIATADGIETEEYDHD